MERVDCSEFTYWYAEYQIEPWGDERDLLGRIAVDTHNTNYKGRLKLEDVLGGRGVPAKAKSLEEMTRVLDGYFRLAQRTTSKNNGRSQ